MIVSVLRMATDMIGCVQHSCIFSDERCERHCWYYCRSKSDASVTIGSRRASDVVNSTVVVLGRGARSEGVTLKMYRPSIATSYTC